MKHTSGPWEVIEDNGDYYVRGSGLTIADCTSWDYQTRQPMCPAGVGEAEANAHLMAAAPELLEALKELLFASNGLVEEAYRRDARAAVAKAEGAL